MTSCNKCGKQWESKSECHCSGCHEHFKSESAFKKHRIGRKERRCLTKQEMENIGMIFDSERSRWISSKRPEGFKYGK